MKISILHDYLNQKGGAEKVLYSLLEIFPHSTIYTIIHDKMLFSGIKSRTSFIQYLPFKKMYKFYMPLFPFAINLLHIKPGLILSSSHAYMKNITRPKDSLHICYCLTPMRYAWDLKEEYLKRENFFLKIFLIPFLLYLKHWDKRSSSQVDDFISISKEIQSRIKRYYNRDSVIIYPPVDTVFFALKEKRQDYYLIVSRLIEYKKVDIAIKAFIHLNNKDNKDNKDPKITYPRKLIIAGTGRDEKRLKDMAKNCKYIEFRGYVDDKGLRKLYQAARAFIHPQIEDFGISAIEAQSCGTPVIAFAKGGALETVIEGTTGHFFHKQSPESLIKAIDEFEKIRFDPKNCRKNALRFDKKIFKRQMRAFIDKRYKDWKQKQITCFLKDTKRNIDKKKVTISLKSVIDYLLAFMLFLISLPLIGIISFFILLISKRSPFFVQLRMGKDNRQFKLYKFRTLDIDSSDTPIIKNKTPLTKSSGNEIPFIGRFLRRTCLDELPQLLNVLKGDMSLVGPRPYLIDEMSNIKRWHNLRHLVKPGLTGVWQISKRSELDFDEIIFLDLGYINNFTILKDFWILIKTIPVIIFDINKW